jgi:tetratricopeptide (TPR) repeat protein
LAPVYTYLGMGYQRLRMFDKAIEAFKYSRHLEPSEADTYISLAQAYIGLGKFDRAAETLLQSIMLDDRKMGAWQLLDEVFKQLNPGPNPAIVMGQPDPKKPPRPQLNLQNPVVQENFIAAYRDFIRVFLGCKRMDFAMSARNAAVEQYKMPANLFDPIFKEKIEAVLPPDPVVYQPPPDKPKKITKPSGPKDLPVYPRTPTP